MKPFSTEIRDGILTIDGMVAKVQLNYDVHKRFLYFTVPGVGTAIVAREHFANSAPQKRAFHDNMLTFAVNGHVVELTNALPIVGKGADEAWVAVDGLYGATLVSPEMGYGDTLARPFSWPGAKVIQGRRSTEDARAITPPPVPANLRPRLESSYTVVAPASQR